MTKTNHLTTIREMLDIANEDLREIEYIEIPKDIAFEIVQDLIKATGRKFVRSEDYIQPIGVDANPMELSFLFGHKVKIGDKLGVKLL